jgi:hypothetical protein
VRLIDEFVPGTESWISFGYLKPEENSNDRGFIVKANRINACAYGMLFQDYMPNIPSVKLCLNLVYNTGITWWFTPHADSICTKID